MNAQININNIRLLNRNIRGWGFVKVIAACDAASGLAQTCVRVLDCETGIEYPAQKSDLRRLTIKQAKSYLQSIS